MEISRLQSWKGRNSRRKPALRPDRESVTRSNVQPPQRARPTTDVWIFEPPYNTQLNSPPAENRADKLSALLRSNVGNRSGCDGTEHHFDFDFDFDTDTDTDGDSFIHPSAVTPKSAAGSPARLALIHPSHSPPSPITPSILHPRPSAPIRGLTSLLRSSKS
jgi:hypothetical protein